MKTYSSSQFSSDQPQMPSWGLSSLKLAVTQNSGGTRLLGSQYLAGEGGGGQAGVGG